MSLPHFSKAKSIIKAIQKGKLKSMWRETLWIYSFVRKYWIYIILYTLLGMVTTVISLGTSWLSKDMVDIITGHKTALLFKTFAMYIGFQVFNIVLNQVSGYASNWINIRVNNEIKAEIFDKILVTDWEYISMYHTGDLMTRWNSDSAAIANGVLGWLPNLLIYSFRFLSTLGMVLFYDPSFAIFALMGFPISLFMSRSVLRRMKRNNARSAAMNAKTAGFNQETFSNIQTIKAFNLLSRYGMRLRGLQHEYLTMRMEFQRLSAITSSAMSFVGLLVSYSCYGWGIYRVWSGAISYGTMTMFLSLANTLTGTLNSLVSLVPNAISITTSAGRLMEIMDLPKEDSSQTFLADGYYRLNHEQGVSIVLRDVSYSYRNHTEVFAHASLDAHPHEIVALVGPSGEGKTTMMRLILSLILPKEGSAYLYHGLKDIPDHRLTLSPSTRQFFSYVPQGNTMFSGTIAENMRNINPDATNEQIEQALRAACAWGFVEKLEEGIHSIVGERGGGFSEGQSQRLSIARALLCQAPVLLLDEATSALDVATERQLLRNIVKDQYPRTCIVTTHRPTVLGACHKVYAIRGKHCELLTKDEIQQLEDAF
jgi:ABC-type multidrug transport system fused ATPase/permease subunit